jgi:hypothetical protein
MASATSSEAPALLSARALSPRAGALLAALAVVVAFGGVLLLGREALVSSSFFYDDEFYYFQIARNVASGRGFTFDGLHATNGFQPLWLLVLVPVFALVPGDVAPLRAVALLETVLVAAAAASVYRLLRARLGEAAALFAAVFLVAQPAATKVFRVGMESSLVLFLLVQAWASYVRATEADERRPGRWAVVGGWYALALLARLELAVLAPLALLLGWRRFASAPRAGAALIAPPALVLAAYAVWSRTLFGTWLPISGLVKATWADALWAAPASPLQHVAGLLRVPWFGERMLRWLTGVPSLQARLPALYLLLLAAAVAAAIVWRRPLVRAVTDARAALIVAACAVVTLADKVVLRVIVEWQEPLLFLTGSVVLAALLHRRPALARAAAAVALVACVVKLPLTLWRARDPGAETVHYVLQASDWVQRNTDASVRMGSWAGGGMIGYFSGRSVVVLDGLVNDLAFYRRVVRGGDLDGYMRDERITWLAAASCGPTPAFAEAFPPVQMPPGQHERLAARFERVAAFHRQGTACPGYSLWRER